MQVGRATHTCVQGLRFETSCAPAKGLTLNPPLARQPLYMARNSGEEVGEELLDLTANFEKPGNDDGRSSLTLVKAERLKLVQNPNKVPHPPRRQSEQFAVLTIFDGRMNHTR
jgi:hypothetical protein